MSHLYLRDSTSYGGWFPDFGRVVFLLRACGFHVVGVWFCVDGVCFLRMRFGVLETECCFWVDGFNSGASVTRVLGVCSYF